MSRLIVFALGVLCGCLPSLVVLSRPQPQPVDLAPINKRIERLAIESRLERDRAVEQMSSSLGWTNGQLAKVAMQQEALDAYVRTELGRQPRLESTGN